MRLLLENAILNDLIILFMLILDNLSYQAAKKTFQNSSKKLIKFEVNQQLHYIQAVAKIKSPTLAEWTEPIALPLFLNVEYRFEIYEKHQFGYNPEELNSIATGKLTIGQNEDFGTWEIISDRGNKIGFLSAKLRRKLKYAPNLSTDPPEAQILAISSIITHITSLKQKRGYVVVSLMGRSHRTEISKSKAGELLFTEPMQIEKTDEITEAKVEVFSFDAKEQQSQLLGSGTLKLNVDHPQKRVILKNQKHTQIGDAFVDYKISSKETYAASKQLAKIIQQKARLNSSRLQPTFNLSASRTLNSSKLYDSSLVRSSLRKSERVSVVNHNTKIFMPTEQRFKSYVDKQNHNVSYLRQRNGMDFLDSHAKAYYKGASIGVGNKSDFTNLYKSNPGVGVYNLPSIWDRY